MEKGSGQILSREFHKADPDPGAFCRGGDVAAGSESSGELRLPRLLALGDHHCLDRRKMTLMVFTR